MIGYILAGIVALFLAVVLIRTACFKPKAQPVLANEQVEFDKDRAVSNLAELVRCKTISYSDHSLEDDGEFEKFRNLLPTLHCQLRTQQYSDTLAKNFFYS